MILVLSNEGDIHARHIAQKLQELGRKVVLTSKADFGNTASVSLYPECQRGTITLSNGTTISSPDVSAVWHRRPGRISAAPTISDELDRSFAQNEWTQALDGFFTLAFRRNVSPPLKQRAATKPRQLSVASQVGLRVPKTLITSDPEEALAFVARHTGAVVHKAITAPPHQFLDTRVWDSDAYRRIADLRFCPTIFQEQIFGPADIRATVVGRQIFSARIQAVQGHEGVDSRLDADAHCEPYSLPIDVQNAILCLMDELELVFGTVDLKLTDSGEHVFLEVNPQGQFLYIEILTGLPISNAMAEFLAFD